MNEPDLNDRERIAQLARRNEAKDLARLRHVNQLAEKFYTMPPQAIYKIFDGLGFTDSLGNKLTQTIEFQALMLVARTREEIGVGEHDHP
jgi:hypothetical protein